MAKKKIIGRIEKVDFPAWNLLGLDAKIDTGAYTSALHCSQIAVKEHEEVPWVFFKILDPSHRSFQEMPHTAPVWKEKKVRNSSGSFEYRIFIKTSIGLFEKIYTIELSLTDRSKMRYPVLLGRKILKNRFLVDVSEKYLSPH